MITTKPIFEEMINSPLRHFMGRVEIFEGSTLAQICGCHDRLVSFTVERTGEQDKFFGFGVSQKLTTKLLDSNRTLNITKNHNLEVEFGVNGEYIYPCPNFFVEEITRDENTNELTIVAYDALYKASSHKVSELNMKAPYSIRDFAHACAALLGVPANVPDFEAFDTTYEEGANFEGTETIREALNAIAEATQTIYYIDKDWELTFKRLDIAGEPVATINKENYKTLKNKDSYTLVNVIHATELGDNVAASAEDGPAQYVRDNPFWELRDDIGVIVERALAAVNGLTLTNFDCSWRGNFLLEIGDKISFITKDDGSFTTYLLNDDFTFDGGLSGKTQLEYQESKSETHSNPSTLGEAIKQTYAKVDKVNKQIDIVASEASNNASAISALQINTNNITASVSKIEENVAQSLDEMSGSITTLTSKVDARLTSEEVRITVQSELSNGVSRVETGKGFIFDDTGLTVEDINPNNNKAIKTTISNNGMTVYRDNQEVLTANDEGVQAADLHATTFLIIGQYSRLEDYNGRTACFWLGG